MKNFCKSLLFVSCITTVHASSNPFDSDDGGAKRIATHTLRPLRVIPLHIPHASVAVTDDGGSSTPRGQIVGALKAQPLTPRIPQSTNPERMNNHRLCSVLRAPILPDATTELDVGNHFPHEVNYMLGGKLGLDEQEVKFEQKLADALVQRLIADAELTRTQEVRQRLEHALDMLFPFIFEEDPDAIADADDLNMRLKLLDGQIKKQEEVVAGKERIIRGLQATLNAVRKRGEGLTEFDKMGILQHSVNLTLELQRKSQAVEVLTQVRTARKRQIIRKFEAQRTALIRSELWQYDALEVTESRERSQLSDLFQQGIRSINAGKKAVSAEELAATRAAAKKAADARKAMLKRL